jgi:AbiJ N-terminal domain 5/CHC2 zinc finger
MGEGILKLPVGFLDDMRAKISISEVVKSWVKWDSRKSNPTKGDYWACCPFHDEVTSSFHIDERKGYFYCFGCHAKGDVVSFIKEKLGVGFLEAVTIVCTMAKVPLPVSQPTPSADPFPTIIELKDFVVEVFSSENFLEIGILTGWKDVIQNHPRLLRSLSWGDPDYAGCVLDVLSRMENANDGSIDRVKAYLGSKFTKKADEATQSLQFGSTEAILGYKYQQPRNNFVGVMMPFSNGFTAVYNSIRNACADAQLECKRADEVWNSSILINDIFELINHSAVVVCDLTGRNENVFYELGVAHAWGKKVIPITQRSEDVPFDLKHHRFLTYLNNSEGLEELRCKLTPRLTALKNS